MIRSSVNHLVLCAITVPWTRFPIEIDIILYDYLLIALFLLAESVLLEGKTIHAHSPNSPPEQLSTCMEQLDYTKRCLCCLCGLFHFSISTTLWDRHYFSYYNLLKWKQSPKVNPDEHHAAIK